MGYKSKEQERLYWQNYYKTHREEILAKNRLWWAKTHPRKEKKEADEDKGNLL